VSTSSGTRKPRRARTGTSWIRSKLSTCKIAIVLWSRASVKSENVRHEVIVARKAGKLLPASIDTLEPEDFSDGPSTLCRP